MLGTRLSRYRIVEKLGEGGMGVVYRAHDEHLGRDVAIKVLSASLVGDTAARRRLRQEASLLSKLNHPNITTIHDFEASDDVAFVVMELVPGRTLFEILAAGPAEERQVVAWAEQLCAGLIEAHAAGIIHRDLKPANLRITPDGRLKILDFGLARLLDTAALGEGLTAVHSQTGALSGTLPYMAPEQFNGTPADARTDIHATGAILYESMTGRRPFAGRNVTEMIRMIVLEQPRSPVTLGARISPGLEQIIVKCLQKEPERRYQSARELLADLQLCRDPLSQAFPVSPVTLANNRQAKSIALLPLANDSGTESYAYLSVALADEIAVLLSRVRSVNVRALSSTRAYAGAETARAAGLKLGVDVVITGRFVVHGSTLRVTLEAIDVATDELLWAATLRVGLDALESIEAEVAGRIERDFLPALGVQVPTATPLRGADARAYDLYLRSLALGENADQNREAIDVLQRVVSIDPTYAPAWDNLGRRYYVSASYGDGGTAAYERSEQAYQRALVLDPGLVTAAAGLITHWTEKGNLAGAFDVARQILTRRPDSIPALSATAYVLRFAGLLRESAQHAETALQLDRDPRLGHAALTYLAMQEYDRALSLLKLREGTAWAENIRMFVHLHRGELRDASTLAQRLASDPAFPAAFVAAFLDGRPPAEVDRLAQEFVSQSTRVARDPESAFLDGTLLSFCEQRDLSLSLVQSAIRGGYCAYPHLLADPLLENVRGTKAFEELALEARARQEEFVAHRDRFSGRSGAASDDPTTQLR